MNGITRVNNELERKWKEADKMKFKKPSSYFSGQTWWRGTLVRMLPKPRFKSSTHP